MLFGFVRFGELSVGSFYLVSVGFGRVVGVCWFWFGLMLGWLVLVDWFWLV